MGTIKIKKGLDLPLSGAPKQVLENGNTVTSVALLGDDYIGMKPTMMVQVGDKVKLGQLLFTDKKMGNVNYTSPGAGTVTSIHRGAKRKFLSVVIELDGEDQVQFDSFSEEQIKNINSEVVKKQLLKSGLWTALRARPFSKVADPNSVPHSIFVTAIDTHPLAPAIDVVLLGKEKEFSAGLNVLSKLVDGKIFLNKAAGSTIPVNGPDVVQVNEFDGPHPAGLVGTHIHFLDPVGRHKTVWYINAQDVVAYGSLFLTGTINVERIVSLAGPVVKNPRLVKTRMGANLQNLTNGEIKDGESRTITGSVLSGRTASNETCFLGRYHQQVSILAEGRKREFLGWVSLAPEKHSIKNVLISALKKGKKFNLTTAKNGGERSIVPIGSYEKVMPLDVLPSFLLRSLVVDDVEEAEKLGCLELDEEDLALCTYVCPSKIDHGKELRRNLTLIEKEG